MNDDRIADLLRTALARQDNPAPAHDLWPAVVDRLETRPRWSTLDLGLVAAVALALLLFPEWVLPLAYHL
jgi:hypothetical protein